MLAAVVTKFGPPEVLQLREVPTPQPGAGEILVRTKAIGLNFAELVQRMGYYPETPRPPFIPGLEMCGVVDKVGKGVTGLARGDRVMGFMKRGSYAEYVALPSERVVRLPKKVSFEHGAALGVAYFTAYHGLITLANIQKGEKLLQHAAAGGVGTAAIQLAKLRGAQVYATASSAQKLEIARTQGADCVINYREEDFSDVVRRETGGYGVDVVMDSVGGKTFRTSWNLLAPMGRYILYGFAGVVNRRGIGKLTALKEFASVPLIYPPTLLQRNVGLHCFNLFFLTHKVEYLTRVAQSILKLYLEKKIHPVIGKTFSFQEIAEAHAYLQSRQSYGKVVVLV
jgi:NADPH:quinone reductase-like Zn-dependent oxidoreductase